MISQCLNDYCWYRLASYLAQFQFKIIIYKEIPHGVNQICSGHNFLVIPVSPWFPDGQHCPSHWIMPWWIYQMTTPQYRTQSEIPFHKKLNVHVSHLKSLGVRRMRRGSSIERSFTYGSKTLLNVYMSLLATQPFTSICSMYQRRSMRMKMEM